MQFGDEGACDFTLSLLYASLNSYRHASLIKPLPPFLRSAEELSKCFQKISFPPLALALSEITETDQQFIDWIRSEADHFELSPFDLAFAETFDISTSRSKQYTPPDFVVTVTHGNASDNFRNLSSVHGTTTAFHGTHTENVFSILRNGLVGHLNKRSLFGAGTYLSSDLGIALSFSKPGKSWPPSCLGRNMLCVLACEVIKSDQVKQGKSKLSGISLSTDSIPHNYCIVENNDHVRVTHVLVYITKQKLGHLNRGKGNKLIAFLRCYGFVLFYLVILFLICLNSKGALRRWLY